MFIPFLPYNLFPFQIYVISTNKQPKCPILQSASAVNCFLYSVRTGPILGLEVLEGYFTGWTEIFLACALYVSKRMIFCSSLMLIAPEIFPKLCSIPLLMSASSPTITGIISVFTLRISVISISRSLYFEIFSVAFVEVFWSDDTDTSVSLQHRLPWCLITTYIRHVRWQLSIRIFLCISKDCNLFNFGDRLRFVLIAPLRYFDFVTLTLLSMDICSCLVNIVPL